MKSGSSAFHYNILLLDITNSMKYYVYALINPESEKPFYIGKGINNRIQLHFKEAELEEKYGDPNTTLDTLIDAEIENVGTDSNNEKLQQLRELLKSGYKFKDVARIIAKGLEESEALTIESLLIKSIYGIENLTNRIGGHYSDRFRPFDNWEMIPGLDFNSTLGKQVRNDRSDLLQDTLDEQLDKPLKKIIASLPDYDFSNPRILDSGELGVETKINNVTLKVFLRKKNIQVELRGRTKTEQDVLENHFRKLDKELGRKDYVFLPKIWKRKGMTSDLTEINRRILLLVEIMKTEKYELLSKNAKELLD